tara:strand:- start:924 stop:1166 length:243 start_codon:yes stop_codon:yes gene_type:complete
MEFLDTPNPNAKKILVDHDFETSIYLNEDISTASLEVSILLKISGIKNIFTGPGFITITKNDSATWDDIIQDFSSKFDSI